MIDELAKVAALFGLAERSIALIDRCRPLNATSEARRTRESWARQQPTNPAWIYAAPPDLGPLSAELARVAARLDRNDDVEALYAARADELELEARSAEAIGGSRFMALARQRYPVPPASEAREQARAWASSGVEPMTTRPETIPSDARTDPRSLLSQMLAEVALRQLPVSVVLRENLQSVAATTSESVLIKPGVRLSAREARRIVVHELVGHVVPRVSARSAPLGLLRVGSAGAADDEEGRALALERRAGLLGRERQVELGRRHLAALCTAEGADWVETVRTLVQGGSPPDCAMEIANRVQRGGGLARELVYLPALARVERAIEREPELDAWLAAGRLSLHAARVLERARPELVERALGSSHARGWGSRR
ncbi:MAG TPA: tyrosine/phenylalanine carboxypeptidase domain-containing protein [Polyangiaceae bacterium]|nr:tyrosine/phenylalanine carboxypeptidase domain-containing protein [Polyangiaceae bacterium]